MLQLLAKRTAERIRHVSSVIVHHLTLKIPRTTSEVKCSVLILTYAVDCVAQVTVTHFNNSIP
jgi:hypothetical protein